MRLSNIRIVEMEAFSIAVMLHVAALTLYGMFSVGLEQRIFTANPIRISLGGSESGFAVALPETIEEPAPEPEPAIIAEAAPPAPVPLKKPAIKARKESPKPVAKQVASLEPKAGDVKAVQPEVAVNTSSNYLSTVQSIIQQKALSPEDAAGVKGRATLRLEFNRQGYVTRYQLVNATGNKALDKATLQLAQRLTREPLPAAAPDFYPSENLLRFDFNVDYPAAK